MTSNAQRQIPELLASIGDSGVSSQYLPLSHSICCKLCLSIFNKAKILPCLHSFCLDCLLAYIRKSSRNLQDRKLLCPTCQEYNKLPGTGIKGLLDNTLIEHSIASNVPTLALRKKQSPLFPGLYSVPGDSYEVLVKRPELKSLGQDEGNRRDHDNKTDENSKWKDFIQKQKLSETEGIDNESVASTKRPVNISEALKGLSDEERLDRLTNSLKNTFSFTQALQEHELKLESDIRALRSSSSSSEYSFTQRDFLQEQLGSLQAEAMNIIYRLDGINTSGDTWERNRARVEQQIHTQSDQLISVIRQIERKLLDQIDSYTDRHAPLNPVQEGKLQLQTLLRNLLNVIDFIRLVLRYGSSKEMEQYDQLVAERCEHLLTNIISVEKSDVTFTGGKILGEEFEKMFGFLTFTTSTEEIWKFKDNEINVDSMISSDSVFNGLKGDSSYPEYQEVHLPPSISHDFLHSTDQMTESMQTRSFTPDSLSGDDPEQQRLTVDQLIHKFSTEFGMRYNEIVPDDSSSNPMTSSITSDNPIPSPIPEEMNGNGNADSPVLMTHSRVKPRSSKRRHSVSDVQQDLAHARIDLSDNRYRGLIRGRKTSIPEMLTGVTGMRPLSNDIEQTKRMLALCKRQLLEAKSMGIYSNKCLTSPEQRLSRSISMSHDYSPKATYEQRMARSTSLSHDYVQRIRSRLNLDKSSPSGPIHET